MSQVPDTFEDDEGESLVFNQTGRPFSPESVGLVPVEPNTALSRGFWCGFRLRERALVLGSLWIGLKGSQQALARSGKGPLIAGRLPIAKPRGGFRYDDLMLPCPFSGSLLIVRGWNGVQFGRPGPMFFGGVPVATVLTYDFVAEYSFTDGVLAEVNDLSSVVADLRRFAVAEGSHREADRRFREHTRFFQAR
ncbi:MAG: hypothetical protein ABTQ32_17420 [Myxococcaceae bacterium]